LALGTATAWSSATDGPSTYLDTRPQKCRLFHERGCLVQTQICLRFSLFTQDLVFWDSTAQVSEREMIIDVRRKSRKNRTPGYRSSGLRNKFRSGASYSVSGRWYVVRPHYGKICFQETNLLFVCNPHIQAQYPHTPCFPTQQDISTSISGRKSDSCQQATDDRINELCICAKRIPSEAQRPSWVGDVNGALQGLSRRGTSHLPRGVGALPSLW
jgi:hypothetical protein